MIKPIENDGGGLILPWDFGSNLELIHDRGLLALVHYPNQLGTCCEAELYKYNGGGETCNSLCDGIVYLDLIQAHVPIITCVKYDCIYTITHTASSSSVYYSV